MDCPKCGNKMEKGLFDKGQWIKGEWGTLDKVFAFAGLNRPSVRVIAWRCSKCGKIELYTEVK